MRSIFLLWKKHGILYKLKVNPVLPAAIYSAASWKRLSNTELFPMKFIRGMSVPAKPLITGSWKKSLAGSQKKIKTLKLWDEELVIAKVKQILNTHLGMPPKTFTYKGKNYTPKSFAQKDVRLPWDNYLTITSFKYAPFYTFIKLNVLDNWAQRKTFFNVPLDVFYKNLKQAVQNGYSVAFDSDTGEPGRIGREDAVFVPEYDIPGKYINQQARELRFKNGSTTDDHLMHILAYKEINGNDWFLVKDSWRTAWDGSAKGYYYFHGDYLKLKALAYLIHKDAIPEIAKRVEALN